MVSVPKVLHRISLTAIAVSLGACAMSSSTMNTAASTASPSPDPRVGLRAGMWDAAQAAWNMKLVSTTPPPAKFLGSTNSDLAFIGKYAIQGNYNGYQVWDISNAAMPTLRTSFFCPASQSDVSVYRNLLFVSGEGTSGRLDCGAGGVKDTVSHDRLRGLRIFDATDIDNPKYIANVQTCRGSHTHTVVEDPNDKENVYVYISGSAGVRSPSELAGCSRLAPDEDPNSALFRIEVIKVPLAHPERAAIVTSPRIFNDLTAPPVHGAATADIEESARALAKAKSSGGYTAMIRGEERVVSSRFIVPLLDSIVKSRNGTGAPTKADSAALRAALPRLAITMFGGGGAPAQRTGPSQCHDITVYPAIARAGGACGGYGLLLDLTDPANPKRIAAVADSNFSYWHSATFSNDGKKVLFTDEWGGGGQPKCRATDKPEWGGNAIFTIENDKLVFQSYYKLPAAQTSFENCVAHNGSLIPVPGRDIMVQSWYQGGISVFDWTDPAHPKEIAFFDRGPSDSTQMGDGGTWSAYWYNGKIVSSEIARGLDILELTPSALLSQNEIDAAKSVQLTYFNAQDQPKIVWPASFVVARAVVDQLARRNGVSNDRITSIRRDLDAAEKMSGAARTTALNALATQLNNEAATASDGARVRWLSTKIQEIGAQ
ncbi:MAG: hypothetical protein ABIS03_00050 [Gemmatimonadaceae bacterium]